MTEEKQNLEGISKGTPGDTERGWGCAALCSDESHVRPQFARGRLSAPYLHEVPVCMLIGGQGPLPNQFCVK